MVRLAMTVLAYSLLPVLPWLWRTWMVTGNPIYPMFAGIFPTRDWDTAAGTAFDHY